MFLMVAVLLTWTGWSVKGERWGRGQSKPSSMPAVIPSEPLQTTDSCGSRSLHLWDNGLKFEFRWLHVSWSQLCLPWRWQRRWTDLSTSELQLLCSWTIIHASLSTALVYWSINEHCLSLVKVSASWLFNCYLVKVELVLSIGSRR